MYNEGRGMIKVNNQELSKNEYQGACYNYMAHTKKQELTAEDKLIVANQLVDTNLLLTEGKKAGYDPTAEDIEANFETLVSQFPSQEQFDKTLQEMGDSIEVVKGRLKDDIILKNFIEGEFYSKITIEEDQVKTFYTENEPRFTKPSEVKASHILVKEEDKINELNTKIKAGESFEELAKENSECPSGQNGGDLGFFGKGKMVPEFETTAFAMGVGEVSDPFKTDFGFHILKVTDKTEGGQQTFEQVSDSIKRHLEQVQAQDVISKKVAELRADATIEIDEASL
ncbi:MAG: peptidylprolyl isomerase [Spirochaetaceae bacterium]